MKIKKIECPNCGYSFKPEKLNSICECPACNTSMYLDDEKEVPSVVNININNYTGSARTLNSSDISTSSKNKFTGAIFAIIILTIAFPLLIFSKINKNPLDKETYRSAPESEPFVKFAEELYGKRLEDITSEDYSSIQYIYFEKYTPKSPEGSKKSLWKFDYAYSVDEKGNPVDLKTVWIDSSKTAQKKDLQIFTNIVSINIGSSVNVEWDNVSYHMPNYKNLKNLRYYKGEDGLSGLLDGAFANPAQIERLEVYSMDIPKYSDHDITIFSGLKSLCVESFGGEEEMDELLKLENLEELDIDISGERTLDLTPLSGLHKLKSLRVASSSETSLSGTEVLYGMPGIETLDLERIKEIKNIDFVKNMPKLNSLRLYDCPVIDIEALRDNTSLTKLSLYGLSEMSDISALSTIINLQKLEVPYLYMDKELFPDLSALSKLVEVKINGGYLDSIQGLSGIEDLTVLTYTKGGEDSIAGLTGLKKITLELYNIGKDKEKQRITTVLGELPNLEELNIANYDLVSSFYITPIFASKSLHSVNISASSLEQFVLYVDFDTMQDNNILKKLSMNGIQMRADTNENDNQKKDMLAVYADDFFVHFPAMEELYIADNYIKNLDFVSNMPNLRVLDISDNYISDVSPLLHCPKLDKLIYGNNPISNLNILPDSVYKTESR